MKKQTKKKAATPKKKSVAGRRQTPDGAKKRSANTKTPAKSKRGKNTGSRDPMLRKSQANKPAKDAEAYNKHRERAAARARMASSKSREIGPLPPVADPERRRECEHDLKLGLETYFPDVFQLGWSPQHITAIDMLTTVLRDGGRYALGMPRGSGKTSLFIHAGLLAMLYNWRRYLCLIGAIGEAGSEMMDTVKVQLESNDLLLADFPEICYPIWCLEGIVQRSKGQTIDGEPTRISWSGRKKIVLPSTLRRGKPVGGGVIQAVGLLGRIRGMNHLTAEGDAIRPDAFLADDPQTDDSARNVKQVERRETLLNGAVLGLAGPGKRIAGMATVTIIQKGDLADRMLDRKQNPAWHGHTFSMVEQFPANQDLWERYAELREIDLQGGDDLLPKATAFYAANRAEMDRGAVVPWKYRREPHELSALQNAMNIKLDNPARFDAEYQNNPSVSNTAIGQVPFPTSDEIVQRINGYKRLEIPEEATHLFTAIDVQQDVLFYVQLAMAEDFTGWVIDYGAYPDQRTLGSYWTLGDLQVSLRQRCGVQDIEAGWFQGLNRLLDLLYAREYIRDDGAKLNLDGTIIDANYGDSKNTVYSVCRQSPHHPIPFHGRGYSAKQVPVAERKRKRGERAGELWFMPAVRGTKVPRHVISDTNAVKSLLARRWTVPLGSPSAWTLFQAPLSKHRMLADQLTSEYPVQTSGRGRDLLEWTLLPGRDNHWLDCCVMAATLALMHGCMPNKRLLTDGPDDGPKRRRRKSLAQLRAEAKAA